LLQDAGQCLAAGVGRGGHGAIVESGPLPAHGLV